MGNIIKCENNCHHDILGQNQKTDEEIITVLSNHVPSSKKKNYDYNLSPYEKDIIYDNLSVRSIQTPDTCKKMKYYNQNTPKKFITDEIMEIKNKNLNKISNQNTNYNYKDSPEKYLQNIENDDKMRKKSLSLKSQEMEMNNIDQQKISNQDTKDKESQEKCLHIIENDIKIEEKKLSRKSQKKIDTLNFTIFKFNNDIKNLIYLENKFYKDLNDLQFPLEEYEEQDVYNSLKNALYYNEYITTKSDENILYYGYIQNNKFHGKGIKVDLKTKKIYEGVYLNNEIQIFGRIVENTGIIYEGEIKNSEKHGKGKQIDLINNTKYIGEFKNNQKDGFGHFEFGSGYYSGFFVEDKITGRGYIENSEFSYVGFFIDRLMNGFGEKKYKDNRCYKGNFKDGKFEGYGQFIWPDGRIYTGMYKNDMKHGEGWIKEHDSSKIFGEWYKGRMIKTKKNEIL